jgi:hypothetical protein
VGIKEMKMSKPSRAIRAHNSSPIGGRFFELRRRAVSGTFIKSLRQDGVSEGTIRKIEQDNKKRATPDGTAVPAADDES